MGRCIIDASWYIAVSEPRVGADAPCPPPSFPLLCLKPLAYIVSKPVILVIAVVNPSCLRHRSGRWFSAGDFIGKVISTNQRNLMFANWQGTLGGGGDEPRTLDSEANSMGYSMGCQVKVFVQRGQDGERRHWCFR